MDLADPELAAEAEVVLDNWRSSHAFPLNTCQMLLRRVARLADPRSEVVQRLKRRPSVFRKLSLNPAMGLERMQDIGGCRAVVRNIPQVYDVLARLTASSIRHKTREPVDYIASPKPDGYRGVHLVMQYQSRRNAVFNRHQIEFQLRTRLQHAWSTAVETVGTFTGHNLKGGEGPAEWLDFFRLVSSEFAYMERAPSVPGVPERPQAVEMIRKYEGDLRVTERLRAFRDTVSIQDFIARKGLDAYYFLLYVAAQDTAPNEDAKLSLHIRHFPRSSIAEASRAYSEAEAAARASGRASDVVLVSAPTMMELKRGYSNYFADTTLFVRALARVLTAARA